MCQMLGTGAAWAAVRYRLRASVEEQMVMMDQFPRGSAVYGRAFVPETRRPLGQRKLTTTRYNRRAVAPVNVCGDPVRPSSWATVEWRFQGRTRDWTDSERRRGELCEKGRAGLQGLPNHICHCSVLSAEIPAPPCKLHSFHHNHSKPSLKQTQAKAAVHTRRDREKHVFAQKKHVFGPNRTVFVIKGNETEQRD